MRTVELEHETSAQAVNAAMRERADQRELEGILAYSEDPLVSTDIVRSRGPSHWTTSSGSV